MTELVKAIREIRSTLRQLVIFHILLSSVIIFLIFLLFFTIFGFYPEYAYIPAALYFIYQLIKRLRNLKVTDVEAKYPNLNERLRTAEDTIGQDNFMIQKLRTEVIDKLKNVKISSFMNLRHVFGKIVAIMILSFLIIVSTAYDIRIYELGKTLQGIDYKPILRTDFFSSKNETAIQTQNMTADSGYELYGKASIAKLDNRNIEMVISLRTDQLDIRNVKKVEDKQFDDTVYEIEARSDTSYQENIAKDQQQLVKDYFNTIR